MSHILITRAAPDASTTAKRIHALGLVPVIAPIFELRRCDRPLPLAASVAATVLTSRHAVAPCPAFLHDQLAFAVGPATAAKARQAGFRNVVNADGNADAVVEQIQRHLAPATGTIFLPTTSGQGLILAGNLRALGYRVIRRIVYQIAPLPHLPALAVESLRAREIASALFFSTESARHFVRLVQLAGLSDQLENVEAVAISERLVMALERLPWRRISVAVKPNQDAMLALLS